MLQDIQDISVSNELNQLKLIKINPISFNFPIQLNCAPAVILAVVIKQQIAIAVNHVRKQAVQLVRECYESAHENVISDNAKLQVGFF